DYPVNAIVFSWPKQRGFSKWVDHVNTCLQRWIVNKIYHSILISRKTEKVFLFPRKQHVDNWFGVRIGIPEISGQLVLLDEEIYQSRASTEGAVWEFLSTIALEPLA